MKGISTMGLLVLSPILSQPAINFIQGPNTAITIVNNLKHNSTEITIGQISTNPTAVRARAYASAPQVFTTAVFAPLLFNEDYYSTEYVHSIFSGTSRFTVPPGQGGVYIAWGALIFATDGTGTGERIFAIYVNGVTDMTVNDTPSASIASKLAISNVLVLNDGDYVEFWAKQTSGGNLSTQAGAYSQTFGGLIIIG